MEPTTYKKLIPHLGEIGLMLGGWLKSTKNPIPNSKSEVNPNFQTQT